MIVRDLLRTDDKEILDKMIRFFDYFNDYNDTMIWLKDIESDPRNPERQTKVKDFISQLEKGEKEFTEWHKRQREKKQLEEEDNE